MNFISGGKLGDFLHSLFAVKNLCEQNNCKADVYMADIGWDYGINNTFNELYPILKKQSYINDLIILTDYELDHIQTPLQNSPIKIYNQKLLQEGYLFNDYINSPLLYGACWSELYENYFHFKSKESKWLNFDIIDDNIRDKVLIHRKYGVVNNSFPYEHICNKYGDRLLFISSKESDYDAFPWKTRMPFKKVETLEEWFTLINSCELIISNLTGPAAIAHSLDKKRLIELPNILDAYHCIGEERYSDNVYWYNSNTLNNFKWDLL